MKENRENPKGNITEKKIRYKEPSKRFPKPLAAHQVGRPMSSRSHNSPVRNPDNSPQRAANRVFPALCPHELISLLP